MLRHALLAATLAAVVTTAGHASDALTVTSSIPDGAQLSAAPLHWSATVAGVASGDSVTRVEFLIDGQLRWTEQRAPYYFQGDDDHGYAEFLYPATLGRGNHTVAVRAVTKSGQQATSSATITVTADPPPVPAPVRGKWHRKLSVILKGTWHITFAPNGIVHVVDPTRLGLGLMFVAQKSGGLTLGRPQDNPSLPSKEDGGFCPHQSDQPYHWKISGKSLTITTKSREPGGCADRRRLFAGVWTRG